MPSYLPKEELLPKIKKTVYEKLCKTQADIVWSYINSFYIQRENGENVTEEIRNVLSYHISWQDYDNLYELTTIIRDLE